MSESTKLPWVVITGIIREPEVVNHLFDFLSDLKKRKIIEQVIFSTWHGELARYLLIEQKILDSEFLIIEATPPSVMCMGSFLHQTEALRNGLQLCPSDAFVFKMRTDKCEPSLGFIEEQVLTFLQQQNYAFPLSQQDFALNYKIGIHPASAFSSNERPVLFWWLDFFYFGYKQDLIRLVNYDVLSRDYKGLIPEQTLFGSLFSVIWPIIDTYFKYVHSHHAVMKMYEQRQNITDEKFAEITHGLISNKLFKMAFVTERFILHRYFFDIYSGQPIPFQAIYCGINIAEDEQTIPYIQALFSGQIRFDISDLELSGQQLQEFLYQQLDIQPIYHRILQGSSNRFQVAPPNYSISFKTS